MRPIALSVRRVFLLGLLLVTSLTSGSATEFRGLWVDAWGTGFLNASQVTSMVNACRTYNYNAVIVQMRRRGDAFYIPQAPNGDPRTTALASNYDALQEIINQCHNGTPRIEVHCWVTTQLIWSDQANAPSQAGHVFNTHPEYLMKNSAGASYIGEGYYLDPGHPDAATWNYNMAKDIVSRYDIDGFHWDYIRYPAQDSGYNATAIARYNTEFGLTGQPSPSNAQFSTWRRRQVTDFLRWCNADLLEVKPNLVVSASVFGSRSDAFNARFQDWAAWNNEGIIDICIPMNYTSDNAVFNSRVDDAYNNQGVRRVYMGLGAYLNTKENTVVQLNYARNKPLLGTSFYSYRVPNSGTVNQTATFTYVRDNYQPSWVNTPVIPWKASPTKGIVKGTVTRSDTGEILYNATVTINTSPTRSVKTEAHGTYGFFEIPAGTYTITVTPPNFGSASQVVTVTAGQVLDADIAISPNDNTAPVISGVTSSSVTDSTATITWNTDDLSDSRVEYGPTTSYGSTATGNANATAHTVNLSGLAASTTYHFRVRSQNSAGLESVSGDFTFTTLASGQVADIIIDNPAATITGTWTLASSATDKYGADYRYKSAGTGAAYLTYRPDILTAGDYQVYEWHSQGSNRSTDAPHVITHSGGTTTIDVNQQTGGGRWNLLGTFNFPVGTTKYVRITDAFTAGSVVIADAIKFVYVAPPSPPAAPSALSASALSATQIYLTWTDNSDNEANFIVSRSTSAGGPYSDIATLAANTTSYNNSGLASGTTYYYVVRAVNGSGSSASSNEASASTPTAPPAAPSGLSATAVSSSQINLSWTDNSNDEENFVIARGTTAGGPYTDIASTGANATSYSDIGLDASTTYYYVVRAINSVEASANSNEASATTPVDPPAAPGSLTAVAVSSSRIDLSWSDNSADESNFIVARSTTAGGPYTDIATLPANTTSYSNTGLAASTTYYYVVRAVNAGGSSGNSNQASATTQAPPTTPVHVHSITMSWVKAGSKYKARAVVNVRDSSGANVSGATVTGNFTGAFTNNGLSDATDSTGNAVITSSSSVKNGTVTFTVTNIAGSGLSYDSAANVVTSATISR